MLTDPSPTSFVTAFTAALGGAQCEVVHADGRRTPLPVTRWTGPADAGDDRLLALCRGATIDLGCGPGRLTAELRRRGHRALGIDLVPAAVELTRARGAEALHRDLFAPLPDEGRWATALLADGNIGIGGDPVRLLSRVRRLVRADHGRVVAEVVPPGSTTHSDSARLVGPWGSSRQFRWAVVAADRLPELAAAAGMRVESSTHHGERWFAVLGTVR